MGRAIDERGPELPKTVLVVEDEVLIRWVIADHLRDCGYRVIEAGSGDEAIEVLRRTALVIDVVFSDVRMPGLTDGFALFRWVRQQRPKMKIVLASGMANAADATGALCEEAHLVAKPYSPAELEQRIQTLLAQ